MKNMTNEEILELINAEIEEMRLEKPSNDSDMKSGTPFTYVSQGIDLLTADDWAMLVTLRGEAY